MLRRDGKADYVWTRSIDGVAKVWYNKHDKNTNGWREGGVFASGVGANGDNVRYAIMDSTERSSYIVLDPATGAPAAWLNGCKDTGCPDPSSTCQFLGADETCIFGYEACLQKMGCGGRDRKSVV